MSVTRIFISSVQKELAAERRAEGVRGEGRTGGAACQDGAAEASHDRSFVDGPGKVGGNMGVLNGVLQERIK